MAASPTSPVSAATADTTIVQRGGWSKRIQHRSALRAYARKIHARQISYEELKDYLEKGGDPTILSNYGPYNPFMSDRELPLLNHFVRGQTPFRAYHAASGSHGTPRPGLPTPASYETDARPDRLRSLKLLLDNGAKADGALDLRASGLEDASPLLWASWLGDVDAMALLVAAGADINLVQKNIHHTSGAFGPPLLLAQNDAAADLVFQSKPNVEIVVQQGRNIVQELVFSVDYSTMGPYILSKLKWFHKRGIRFGWQAGGPEDPVRTALSRARAFASSEYTSTNPYLPSGPEQARTWEEIAATLKALKAPG